MNKQKLIVIKRWETIDTIYAPKDLRGDKLEEWCRYNVAGSAQPEESKLIWVCTIVEYDSGDPIITIVD